MYAGELGKKLKNMANNLNVSIVVFLLNKGWEGALKRCTDHWKGKGNLERKFDEFQEDLETYQ